MKHNGPGKSYRKGISLVALTRMFPDDETAERWFTQTRWPDGPSCPYCGSVNFQFPIKHKSMTHPMPRERVREEVQRSFGDSNAGVELGYQVWAIAFYLLTTNLKGVSSMKLSRDLEITQKSAWHLAQRIRQGFSAGTARMQGPV